MADIETPTWRCKHKVGSVMSRVQAHANGTLSKPMSSTELKAAEIYLRKVVPDLRSMELTGKDGGAIVHAVSVTDKDILQQYLTKGDTNDVGVQSKT